VDNARIARFLAAFLMAILGIIYLVMAAFFGSLLETMEIAPALVAVVGVAYVALAAGLFAGNRLFNYLGIIVPLIWASMGIIHYTVKPDPTEFPFIAAEVTVILCSCYLILHKRSS
jgi:hypothetical protein